MKQAAPQADLIQSQLQSSPHDRWRKLREQCPVLKEGDRWMVTGHAAVAALHRDRRTTRAAGGGGRKLGDGPASRFVRDILLFQDPPNHTRLRSFLWPAFRPGQIARLRPYIEAVTDAHLAVMARKREADLVADLAYPVPMRVIGEFLGVPEADREDLRVWSRDSALAFQPTPSPEEVARADSGVAHALSYMKSLIEDLRPNPGENFLSSLIHFDSADRLSDEELATMGFFLVFAGHETTSDLISNGVLALLNDPVKLELLRRQPALIKSAVEELARYDGPIQTLRMRATETIEVEQHRIEADDQIFTVLASANRDPRAFDDPDRLDITRSHNDHLAFGAGIHYCVGAPLARLEVEIVVGRLVKRFTSIELRGEPTWKQTFTVRGLSSLPVRVSGGSYDERTADEGFAGSST